MFTGYWKRASREKTGNQGKGMELRAEIEEWLWGEGIPIPPSLRLVARKEWMWT